MKEYQERRARIMQQMKTRKSVRAYLVTHSRWQVVSNRPNGSNGSNAINIPSPEGFLLSEWHESSNTIPPATGSLVTYQQEQWKSIAVAGGGNLPTILNFLQQLNQNKRF